MSRSLPLLAMAGLILGTVGCGPEEDAAALGKVLFEGPGASRSSVNKYSCATCHRATAEAKDDRIFPGAVISGAHERPSFWQGQEVDLLRAINHCRVFFMVADKPWTREDEQARAMYAYILSLPSPVKEAVPFTVVGPITDLPAGSAEKGKEIYRRACRSCHGEAHTAAGRLVSFAPLLPEQTLAAHSTYSPTDKRLVFVEKARHGAFLGYAGYMPPFSREVLSDEDLAALLSFLELY